VLQEQLANYQQLFTLDKMIKLKFNKVISEPLSELVPYSSFNPIPATLKLSNTSMLSNTIYSRNLSGENFIEFRFNKDTKKLYEITIVAIQEDTVKLDVYDWNSSEDDYYECFILDENCDLEFSIPIQILRSENALSFSWGDQTSKKYAIAKNCILGIDTNNNLCSIILVYLSKELIYKILGF
jgi:hypothetical protein